MSVCLQCMSHSPLITYTDPPTRVVNAVWSKLQSAAKSMQSFDPELTFVFFPDHFNGFFYDNMPVYCIGAQATAIGDYDTPAGPLNVPEELAVQCAEFVLRKGYDVSLSYQMIVDHAVAQPMEILFGGLEAPTVIPVFINSVATPLAPMSRIVGFGRAIGEFAQSTGKRVLLLASGGLSHDPPLPRLNESPDHIRQKLINGRHPTPDERLARQERVINTGRLFAQEGANAAGIRPLNPEWDRKFMAALASSDFEALEALNVNEMASEAGHSSHEVRTWIAAFSALHAFGEYEAAVDFYEPINEWIAGFGIMSAKPKSSSR